MRAYAVNLKHGYRAIFHDKHDNVRVFVGFNFIPTAFMIN